MNKKCNKWKIYTWKERIRPENVAVNELVHQVTVSYATIILQSAQLAPSGLYTKLKY